MTLVEPLSASLPELSISADVINSLRGTVSHPIKTISHKPGFEGKEVEVRLALQGPAMFGLTDRRDNKEWSGITNHVLLSARYAVYFAQRMAQAGYEVDPQRILDGMIVSHAGRRQWDEAGWYLEAVGQQVGDDEAKRRRSISNETLSMQLIQGKVPQEAFDLVVALGHNVEGFSVNPAIYSSLDFLIAIYVDHRTAQKYEPLNTRMGDFLLGNFFSKEQRTPEKKAEVYAALGNLIGRQKVNPLGTEGVQEVLVDVADQIAEDLGASPNSERLSRRDLMRLILQDAQTEAMLIQARINPEAVDDETVPIPKWEHDFRLAYIEAAKDGIVARLQELITSQEEEKLNREFPQDTWWSLYARKLFNDTVYG